MINNQLSPANLILKRCRAFVDGDFGFIYDIHHPDSFFRRLYPDRQVYLDYADSALRQDFSIRECRILKEDVGVEEARVIYYLDISFRDERRESFELCWLRRLEGKWRYLATQKIERQDLPGEIEAVDWDDFARVEEKMIF